MNSQQFKYYCNRAFQELSFRTGISFARPSGIIIVLTNKCNARCVHCHSYKLENNLHELTANEWGKAFSELRHWLGPVFVSLTGGETLTRKDVLAILNHATRNGFWVEFLTNGYALDEVLAEKLIESGVRRITISLDGTSPDVHDKIRGRNGFFDKASRSVKMLVDQNRTQGRDVLVRLKTVIMRLNLHDIHNIPILAKKFGVEGVEYQALTPIYYSDQLNNEDWHVNNDLWVNSLADLQNALIRIKELKTLGYPVLNTNENLDLIFRYFSDPNGQKQKVWSHNYRNKSKRCRSWMGLQILPDGGMKMCHWMEPFQNIRDGDLSSGWKIRPHCWKEKCGYRER